MWQCQCCEDRDIRLERGIEKVGDVLLGWCRMEISMVSEFSGLLRGKVQDLVDIF